MSKHHRYRVTDLWHRHFIIPSYRSHQRKRYRPSSSGKRGRRLLDRQLSFPVRFTYSRVASCPSHSSRCFEKATRRSSAYRLFATLFNAMSIAVITLTIIWIMVPKLTPLIAPGMSNEELVHQSARPHNPARSNLSSVGNLSAVLQAQDKHFFCACTVVYTLSIVLGGLLFGEQLAAGSPGAYYSAQCWCIGLSILVPFQLVCVGDPRSRSRMPTPDDISY